VLQHLVYTYDVGEAGLDVEQRELVRDLGAVLYGLAHDDRLQVVALRVGRGGAHARGRRAPGDEQRIDAVRDQVADQRRAREGTRVLLVDDQLAGFGLHAVVDLARAPVPLAEPRREVRGRFE